MSESLKNVFYLILRILMIPLCVLTTTGIIWYTLPAISTTIIGTKILSVLSTQLIFWITLCSSVLLSIFTILTMLLSKNFKARYKNFFIHFDTWLMALLAIGLAITVFVISNPLISEQLEITTTRKIGIGISIILLIVFYALSGKIGKIINRRIQAYESAKEANVIGRGSVFFTNLLKVIELFFPEIAILAIICFCVSWNVACYFLVMIASFIVPMLGNIACDLNIRSEIKVRNEKDKQELVERISNNIKGE